MCSASQHPFQAAVLHGFNRSKIRNHSSRRDCQSTGLEEDGACSRLYWIKRKQAWFLFFTFYCSVWWKENCCHLVGLVSVLCDLYHHHQVCLETVRSSAGVNSHSSPALTKWPSLLPQLPPPYSTLSDNSTTSAFCSWLQPDSFSVTSVELPYLS